ncbi:LCP family protein [Luedemannella helvata]|uniref:Cell envelope-related transcriptional attenuator domain-containing protein n=1 Tax=Luedemannella helvata TaxID=349315 RepID=A0ABN2K695_9ACTN
MSGRVRVILLSAVALVLVVAGIAFAANKAIDKADKAIPQTDLFGSATPSAGAPASPTPEPGADIKGPLDILLVGIDSRESIKTWQPHADTVMILHVTKDLEHAYLTSLPRDLVVPIPAFKKANFPGETTKLTHAMSYGARVPGTNIPKVAQGFELLAKTVSNYTGIKRFDAGGILTFNGMKELVDSLGGIDIYVDQKVTSIHRNTKGQALSRVGGTAKTYKVGQQKMNGWQALDYARQRYISGSDYARQRHNRQLVKAIMVKLFSRDVVANPANLDKVVKALGKTLTFDGRGHRLVDYAFALKNLKPANVTLVGLPGGSVMSGGSYRGEALNSIRKEYFAALRADALDEFVTENPKLVNKK